MGIGILLVDKVGVIGTDEFDVQFLGKLHQGIINEALFLVGLMIGTGDSGLVALQFQVIIITKHILEPLNGLTRLVHLTIHDQLGNLTAQARRAADDAFMVFLQLAVVGSGMGIKALGPAVGDNFNEVLVALQILGQQDQVATDIALVDVLMAVLVGDIDLTAEDGLELLIIAAFLVQLGHIVVKFLDAEHVAVVGNGHAAHAVGYSLVDQRLDRSLSVKNRVL